MKKKSYFYFLFAIFGFFTTPFLFQNCAQPRSSVNTDMVLSQNHPSLEGSPSGSTQTRLLLGDSFYVLSVFRDVFLTNQSSAAVRNFVETVLTEEILSNQTEFGRACSFFHDGFLHKCNNDINNQALAMKSTNSTLREAARIQTCQRLVNNDSVLFDLINRVRKSTTTPNRESVEEIVHLFFPAIESSAHLIDPLLALDMRMAQESERTIDRWRMIVLLVCEEPGWQLY